MLLLFFGLCLSLAFAQATTCPQSPDLCTVAACPCAQWNIVQIQTSDVTKLTLVRINVTNTCASSVFWIQFAMGAIGHNLTLIPINLPVNYVSRHLWTASIYDGRAETPAAVWLRFTPTAGKYPGNPVANNVMTSTGAGPAWELFSFNVQNYYPTYPWTFEMHTGDVWDLHGPVDASLCQCSNCDAAFALRTVQPCSLGYYSPTTQQYGGPTNRASSGFNENSCLYSYGIFNNYLALFYTDEFPMNLGISTIIDTISANTPVITNFPISQSQLTPTCIYAPFIQFGAKSFDGTDPLANIDSNGPDNGCVEPANVTSQTTCGRPVPPTLFITDVSSNQSNRDGDWQYGGDAFLPQKICGLWTNSTKYILGRNPSGTFNISVVPTYAQPPFNNISTVGSYWNMGAGSDTPPPGFINPSAVPVIPFVAEYGVEVAWDLDQLNLAPQKSYRFQFMVHDGDANKVGGDVGLACLITDTGCPAGLTGDNCTQCDNKPLPGDGSYSWFCSYTGVGTNPYTLQKQPTSKIAGLIALDNRSFIPIEGNVDFAGYPTDCTCQRLRTPCPDSLKGCCALGKCNDLTGKCECTNYDAQHNATSCCPFPVNATTPTPTPTPGRTPTPTPGHTPTPTPGQTPTPTPTPTTTTDCYNNGSYCNGNGLCQNGTCVCFPQPDGVTLSGVACNETSLTPPDCSALKVSNCSQCVDTSRARGLQCVWCPNSTSQKTYTVGVCVPDFQCPNNSVFRCEVPPVVLPPKCPDNCTGNGVCVNSTKCDDPTFEGKEQKNGKTYSCKANKNATANASVVCACVAGFQGINCALVAAGTDILAPVLAAGIIAAIVLAALLGLLIAGGGAAAAASGLAGANTTSIVNNPIYVPGDTAYSNPLFV